MGISAARPPTLQEHQHHEGHEADGFEERLHDVAHRIADERGRVVGGVAVDTLAEPRLKLGEAVVHPPRHVERVGPRQQADRQADGRGAVEGRAGGVLGRPEFDAGHVADAHHGRRDRRPAVGRPASRPARRPRPSSARTASRRRYRRPRRGQGRGRGGRTSRAIPRVSRRSRHDRSREPGRLLRTDSGRRAVARGGDDGKGDERQQCRPLGDGERRLGLRRREGVQRRHLLERLDDQDEDVQV